jgi:hypothetical protein
MDIDSMDFPSVKDLIDKTLDALNEAWIACGHDEPPYPQKRMKHFMDCIGFSICRYIQRKLSQIDLISYLKVEVLKLKKKKII